MNSRLYTFVGGSSGVWGVGSVHAVKGSALPCVSRVAVVPGDAGLLEGATWILRGITSNTRYVTAKEQRLLLRAQPALGRPEAIHAALIPVKKSAVWWELPHEERRTILEDRSRHVATGLRYLPAVARRLHHCRDLSESEPFDFVTWFEFAPSAEAGFDELLAELRQTEEWDYVIREVDIRLTHESVLGSL